MNYPKISIVTPSFNQAEFLEQTICSVFDQNYPNLEYVIIDGGSTDGSIDIIKKYADRLTFWVSEKDAGQYDAINKGFFHTTGDIMGWINSSDILYPWTFNSIAEIFENNSKVQWISGMPSNLGKSNYPQKISCPIEKNVYDILCGDYKWIQQESTFWKRSLWNQMGGKLNINIRYAGDLKLWLDFYNHTSLYYVNTILGGFRYHDIRRGDDVGGTYFAEADDLYKQFKSTASFRNRLRAFLTKIFLRKNKVIGRVLKKLGIFSWYKHYDIEFDFYSERWSVRIR